MVLTRTRSNAGGTETSETTGSASKDHPVKSQRHTNVGSSDAECAQNSGEGSSTATSKQCSSKSPRNISDSVVVASPPINLLQLPVEIMEKILGYLPYATIGHLRIVSHRMDVVCGNVLNFKFQRLQVQMASRFQELKSKMPRRESARRSHPLACEADVIETLHMRLTLLQMTFGKHIERKHCCFFAGEILDECYRIINYIRVTQKLSRPYKVTDELFDLSTMAMEYFKDQIEPTLPEIPYFTTTDIMDFSTTYTSNNFLSGLIDDPQPSTSKPITPLTAYNYPEPSPSQTTKILRNNIRRMKQTMKRCNNQLAAIRRDIRGCRSTIAEQQNQLLEYSSRLDDHDKKSEENSRKCSTFLQELNKCKTELQYWRSKSPALPPNCVACGHVFDIILAEEVEELPVDQPEPVVEPVVEVMEEVVEEKVTPKKGNEIVLKLLPVKGAQKRKSEASTSGVDQQEAGSSKSKVMKLKSPPLKQGAASTSSKTKKPLRVLLPRGKNNKN